MVKNRSLILYRMLFGGTKTHPPTTSLRFVFGKSSLSANPNTSPHMLHKAYALCANTENIHMQIGYIPHDPCTPFMHWLATCRVDISTT